MNADRQKALSFQLATLCVGKRLNPEKADKIKASR